MLKKIKETIKSTLWPRFFAYSAKTAVRLLLLTCRVKVENLEGFYRNVTTSPCILMLWHNRLILVAEILSRHAPDFLYSSVISKSRDGAPLARLAESYRNSQIIRVPHNSRHFALTKAIDFLTAKRRILIITPDGPRGPCYSMKPGAILAAKKTSAKIIPFAWKSNREWTLKTWDGLRIPKPFSTITVKFGEEILLAKERKQNWEEESALLSQALFDLFVN